MMFSLNIVDYSMSFFSLSTWDFFRWTIRGDHSEPFLLFVVYCGTHEILVSAQGPLVLGFGVWGLGPGLDNLNVIPFRRCVGISVFDLCLHILDFHFYLWSKFSISSSSTKLHLNFTWTSPNIHLTFTWTSPDHYLTFSFQLKKSFLGGPTHYRPYLRVHFWCLTFTVYPWPWEWQWQREEHENVKNII